MPTEYTVQFKAPALPYPQRNMTLLALINLIVFYVYILNSWTTR